MKQKQALPVLVLSIVVLLLSSCAPTYEKYWKFNYATSTNVSTGNPPDSVLRAVIELDTSMTLSWDETKLLELAASHGATVDIHQDSIVLEKVYNPNLPAFRQQAREFQQSVSQFKFKDKKKVDRNAKQGLLSGWSGFAILILGLAAPALTGLLFTIGGTLTVIGLVQAIAGVRTDNRARGVLIKLSLFIAGLITALVLGAFIQLVFVL